MPAPPLPLCAGLKRYFHSKRGEGLLSAQGLRILSYACDLAIDLQQPLVGLSWAGHCHNAFRGQVQLVFDKLG